jgi:hypothetical protein
MGNQVDQPPQPFVGVEALAERGIDSFQPDVLAAQPRAAAQRPESRSAQNGGNAQHGNQEITDHRASPTG